MLFADCEADYDSEAEYETGVTEIEDTITETIQSSHKIIPTDNIGSTVCQAPECYNLTEYLVKRDEMVKTDNLSEFSQHILKANRNRMKTIILRDLLANNYIQTKYECKSPYNTKLIKDIFDIVKQLPPIATITKSKPEVPQFDEIEVYKSDSAEIKKFIRKINVKMLGYSCNHKTIDEKCDKVVKNITDLMKGEEYKCYERFIDKGVSCIMDILRYNENEELAFCRYGIPNKYQDEGNTLYLYADYEIKEVVEAIVMLNGKIAGSNSQTNKRCSKCEAIVRLYNYSVKEVARMREELAEQKAIDAKYEATPGEEKYDIKQFLAENYPTINRFPLKDVKDRYKATFKLGISMDELQQRIEGTGLFTVTNVHNVRYVNRK